MRASRLSSVFLGLVTAGLVLAGCGGGGGKTNIAAAPAFSVSQLAADPGANWITVHGDLNQNNHSTLTQITPSNASKLGLAWMTHLGGSCLNNASCAGEGNALVYDGTMYMATGADDVFAVNAATGKHLWEYKPGFVKGTTAVGGVNRGIAMGAGRIYVGRIDASIAGLNMKTGKQEWVTNLASPQQGYMITGAPVYYKGEVIVPMSGGDSGNSDYLAAVNASTGKLIWKWNDIPGPGQAGYKTWGNPNAYKNGGGAIWDAVSVDPQLNMVYVGTGNQVPWNTRPPGKELYADAVIALNATTGKMVWDYQTVHHDVWDDDIPSTPVIFNGKYRPYKVVNPGHLVMNAAQGYNGTKVVGQKIEYTGPAVEQPALAVASKMGWVFILNRKTGQPLIPTPEVKVPTGGPGTAGLNLWPTQPIPAGDSYAALCVLPSQWNAPGPDGKPVAHGCVYTPVGFNQFTAIPHDEGEWMPSAYDPSKNELYTCVIDNRAWAMKALAPSAQAQVLKPGAGYTGIGLTQGLRQGYTGTFTAMNLATDRIAWQDKWPDFCYSGATSTAGGIVLAGHNNGSIEAMDSSTGENVWEAKVPSTSPAANAPVITYAVKGKQYISVFAGGDAHESTPRGDIIYTYALGSNAKYTNVKNYLPSKKKASSVPGGIPSKALAVAKPTGNPRVINVAMYEFAFKLSSTTIPSGKVTFNLYNVGTVVHNFDIQGVKASPYVEPGQKTTITVKLKPGAKLNYICDVPYHASYGMTGSFTVK